MGCSMGAAKKVHESAQQMGSVRDTIRAHDLVAFVSSPCPYCVRALQAMRDAGLRPHVVEVSEPLRRELTSLTGSTTVPQVFAKGEFVGGCTDGGLGGVMLLLSSGKLQDMLSEKKAASSGSGSAKTRIAENELIAFVSSGCPYCQRATNALWDAGLTPAVVEVSPAIREELTSLTGSTTVPQVFARGKFVGGCTDGGLGGVLPLLRSGKLQDMLGDKSGASSGSGSVKKQIAENELIAFVSSGCPYCERAMNAMRDAGLTPTVVEVTPAIREELTSLTGSTSVPQVFARGKFVGGCTDGGLGGVLPLLRSGKLQDMLSGKSGASSGSGSVKKQIAENELIAFVSSGCPYCQRAMNAMRDAGLTPTVVEVSPAAREELTSLTGSTSVPQVFARGKFVGGCNDGGLGGVLPLLRSGKLQDMLSENSGASSGSGSAKTQIAENELIAFVSSGCPYCERAMNGMRVAGLMPVMVEVTPGIREELTSLTGSTSVPQVFARGKFVGGCNDGGLGGVLPLLRSGKLQDILRPGSVKSQVAENELVAFVSSGCPYCSRAVHAMRDAGFVPVVVEVSPATRKELTALTGSTSVPQVFARGKFVGGCNDGGLGGVLPLLKSGKFRALLEE